MKITYNWESLRRHGITSEEADEIYSYGRPFAMRPSKRGNDCFMMVGFTKHGRLLEIGVEVIIPDEHEHLFHADRITKYYRSLYI